MPRDERPEVPAKSTSMPSCQDRHRGGQAHRFLIAVGVDFASVGAARDAGDLGQRGAEGAVEDERGQRIQAGHLELVHHLDQPLGAGVVAGA